MLNRVNCCEGNQFGSDAWMLLVDCGIFPFLGSCCFVIMCYLPNVLPSSLPFLAHSFVCFLTSSLLSFPYSPAPILLLCPFLHPLPNILPYSPAPTLLHPLPNVLPFLPPLHSFRLALPAASAHTMSLVLLLMVWFAYLGYTMLLWLSRQAEK